VSLRATSGRARRSPQTRDTLPQAPTGQARAHSEGRRRKTPTHRPSRRSRQSPSASVTIVAGAIYEQDFLDCSTFTLSDRNRSAHQALQRLWEVDDEMGGGVVIEVDIRLNFRFVDHPHRGAFPRPQGAATGCHASRDRKWLTGRRAGDVRVSPPEEGTRQVAASSRLANVSSTRYSTKCSIGGRARGSGRHTLFANADTSFVVLSSGPTHARDGRTTERSSKSVLTLHPEKTARCPFAISRPPSSTNPPARRAAFTTWHLRLYSLDHTPLGNAPIEGIQS